MIWGLVFSYVEGRRVSELLGAMLCASFILSSGVVKSVAVLFLHAGVPETWMPAVTGAAFTPVLLVSLWWLRRGRRRPMPGDEAERHRTRADAARRPDGIPARAWAVTAVAGRGLCAP